MSKESREEHVVQEWVKQTSWHEFVWYFQRNVEILLLPQVQNVLGRYMEDEHLDAHERTRILAAVALLREVQQHPDPDPILWTSKLLEPFIASDDPAIRRDAMRSLLALYAPRSAEQLHRWPREEWMSLLEVLVDDVVTSSSDAATVDSTLSFVEGELSPHLSAPIASSAASLAMGRLSLAQQGDRSVKIARAWDFLVEARETAILAQDLELEAKASLRLGQAAASRAAQDLASTLSTALDFLEQAHRGRSKLTKGERDELDLQRAYVMGELGLRSPGAQGTGLISSALQIYSTIRTEADSPTMEAVAMVNEASLRSSGAKKLSSQEADMVHELFLRAISMLGPSSDDYNWGWARLLYTESGLEVGPPFQLDRMLSMAQESAQHFEALGRSQELETALCLKVEIQMSLGLWNEALGNAKELIARTKLYDQVSTVIGLESRATNLSRMSSNAAYCLCRLGRLDEAIKLSEEGRMLTSSEMLAVRALGAAVAPNRADIQEQLSALTHLEAQARGHKTSKTLSEAELVSSLVKTKARLNSLVADAGRRMQSQELSRAHPLERLVATVFVIPSRVGTAIVVEGNNSGSSMLRLRLCSFTTGDLRKAYELYGTFLEAKRRPEMGVSKSERLDMLEQLLQSLSHALVSEIDQQLESSGIAARSAVQIVGSYGLASLPLGACIADSRLIGEKYDLKVVPTTTLMDAVSTSREVHRQPSNSVTYVIDPSENLWFAKLEGELLKCMSPDGQADVYLAGNRATRPAVQNALRKPASMAHFACHGVYEPEAPWSSYLLLADGELSAAELLTMDLRGIDTVVLSACETATSDIRRAPDEYVSIRTAFLVAGVGEVVATLWSVDDASTGLLVSRARQVVLSQAVPMRIALTEAQRWLRTSTTQALIRWVVQERKKLPWWRLDKISARKGLRELQGVLEYFPEDRLPYAHPYFWAAFVVWDNSATSRSKDTH